MHTEKFANLIIGLSLVLTVLGFIGLAILGAKAWKWFDQREKTVMAIEYCFTESGEHYVCD